MGNEIQNTNVMVRPLSRVLHLVGEVEKKLVTYLIDNIMAINDEEEELKEFYKEEARQLVDKINIHKVVEEDTGQVGITMKREPVQPIELHINSGGGSLIDGMALINIIKTSDVPVVAIVSNAESMASVIALTCDRVITYPTTTFMIHELAYDPMFQKLGNHKKLVEDGVISQARIDKIILDNSEIPPEDLKAHYESGEDWKLYGDDLRDYGITNQIMTLNPHRDTTFTSNDTE